MARAMKYQQSGVHLVLPWPPSVNGYWRSIGTLTKRRVVVRQVISEAGRNYRQAAIAAVLEQGSPRIEGPVRVKEHFFPKTRRKFDLDNFRKASRDALVHAGVIEDDSLIEQDMGFKYRPDAKGPRVEIYIEPLRARA